MKGGSTMGIIKTDQLKRKQFRKSFSIAVCLLTILLMIIPVQSQARNIKVGIIDCYSGPAAVYGKDALNGFKLALEDINKKGVFNFNICICQN